MVKMSEYANLEHDYVKEGIAYNKAQMYGLAVEAFQKALESNFSSDELYNELGLAYFHQNNFSAAKEAFEKAIDSGESSYKAYNNLAWIYHFNNENDKALEYFNKALKLSPLNVEIINNCGEFYFALKKIDEALDYFLQCASINDFNGEIYFKIARCYIEKNLFNDAIMYLNKALLYDKNNSEYYRELARIYYKKNDMLNAQANFEKLIELEPTNEWAYSNLGNIYFYYYENLDIAYEYYKKAYALNSAYCWAAYNLANMKVIYKDYSSALELYISAYNLAPQNPLFINALASTYYKLNDIEQAIFYYEKVLEYDSVNETALLSLAQIYLKNKKDYAKAKDFFVKVIKNYPQNAEAYYGLAKLFFFDFDKKNAIINIEAAIDIDYNNDKYKALKNKIREELRNE